MDPSTGNEAQRAALREIPRWADRYARNRVLPVLVIGLAALFAAGLIAGLSAGAGLAYRGGRPALAVVLAAADLAFCVYWLWLVLSKRLQRLGGEANTWLYRGEGEVTPAAAGSRRSRLDNIVGLAFAAAVIATPMIASSVDLPLRYLQPLTAAYTVPFMAYLCYRQRRFSTPLMLLWPGLYALHAVLVLAGVPVPGSREPMLSVLLPMFGYQVLTVLIAHLYSRYALHRLRAAAEAAGGEGDDADGAC